MNALKVDQTISKRMNFGSRTLLILTFLWTYLITLHSSTFMVVELTDFAPITIQIALPHNSTSPSSSPHHSPHVNHTISPFYYVDPIGHYHGIPDIKTTQYLMVKMEPIPLVKSTLDELQQKVKVSDIMIGTDFPSVKDVPENNPDNIILKHMVLFEGIQGGKDLFEFVQEYPGCYNPSIARLRNKYMLACRNPGLMGALSIGWLDENFQVNNKESLHGLGPGMMKLNLFGEDYRLVSLNDNEILLSYCYYLNNSAQIIATKIYFDQDTDKVVISDDRYHLLGHNPKMLKEHQKNWTPFMDEEDKVMLLYSLQPIVAYHYSQLTPTIQHPSSRRTLSQKQDFAEHYLTHHRGETRSRKLQVFPKIEPHKIFLGDVGNFTWKYGMIKGGTPAIRISNETYFGFFHAKEFLRPNFQTSYIFGAYTFQAKPPYSIQSFSRVPLVHRKLYDGKWSHYHNFIDYIVFPMSFVLKDERFNYKSCHGKRCWKKQEILLSLGWQDLDGYLLRCNLFDILKTLVPVSHV